jgi:hypothetical protein
MIKVSVANAESRERDTRRKRLLLTIGNRSFHITRKEGLKLLKSLARYKLG